MFQFGAGRGMLVSAAANSPVGPSVTEAFPPSGPWQGKEQSPAAHESFPHVLSPAVPCPAGGLPLKCFPSSSIKRTAHIKDGRKGLEELIKRGRRGGKRGEEGHSTAAAAIPWWPGARVCVSVYAFG